MCNGVHTAVLGRAADNIVVINEGRVVEEGGHDTLLARVRLP